MNKIRVIEKEDDISQKMSIQHANATSTVNLDNILSEDDRTSPFKQRNNDDKYRETRYSFNLEDPGYSPISKEIDYEELKILPNFNIKKFDDAIYKGEVQDGKRHGAGVMIYKNGRVYEGQWVADLRHGKGYEKYTSGNQYLGNFSRGKAHGKGTYTWANKETYEGEWQNGLKHGYGMWKGNFGESYIGEWKNSKADGFGVHTWRNGDRYEGEWKMGLKVGKGADLFANGDKYVGHYQEGKPETYGQYTWKNGSCYVGEFKNGLKHGKGKWKKDKNTVTNQYEGEYVNDKKCGYGVFTWASGNIYKGFYKDDEREGQGEMRWTDGSVYLGEWVRGIQHGYGKMIFPDSSIKEGYFENNMFKSKHRSEEKSPYIDSKISPYIDSKISPMMSQMAKTTNQFNAGRNIKSNSLMNRSLNGFNTSDRSLHNIAAKHNASVSKGNSPILPPASLQKTSHFSYDIVPNKQNTFNMGRQQTMDNRSNITPMKGSKIDNSSGAASPDFFSNNENKKYINQPEMLLRNKGGASPIRASRQNSNVFPRDVGIPPSGKKSKRGNSTKSKSKGGSSARKATSTSASKKMVRLPSAGGHSRGGSNIALISALPTNAYY